VKIRHRSPYPVGTHSGLKPNEWHKLAPRAVVITQLVLESTRSVRGESSTKRRNVLGYVDSDPGKSLR